MNPPKYYLKILYNNPIEFYSKTKGVIASYLLKFNKYKSNDSIEEINRNWRSYSYLKNKYKKYLDNLPTYKEWKERENIIRRCWLQWEENAPKFNKSCLKSVKKYVKDKNIIVIDESNINEYVKFPSYIIKKYKKGIISKTHFSDLIRLELLINYWWTWIDSTVLLTDYQKVFFDSDFFVFNNFHRGDESIALSSRFITSNKNNPILLATRDLLYKYWENNDYLLHYLLFHLFFTLATKKYPEIWNKIPKYSNIPPHIMQYEFLWSFKEERFEQLKNISSIHKLTHKIDRKKLSRDSLFEHIENM